jgi:hypothetical protein
MEPTADRRVPGNGRCPPGEDQEGGLKDVLGVVPIVQHALANTEDHRPMPLDQERKGSLITLGHEGVEQFPIRAWFAAGRGCEPAESPKQNGSRMSGHEFLDAEGSLDCTIPDMGPAPERSSDFFDAPSI